MSRRIVSLLLCLFMLLALPVSAAASQAQDDTVTQAGTTVRYVPSGSVTFGSISLYDPDGNELPLEYAYSSNITISGSIASKLTAMLSGHGFSLPVMNYNYQLMNRQSFFVVRVTDGQALAAVIDGIMNRRTEAEAADTVVSAGDAAVSETDLSSSDAWIIPPYEGGTSFVTPEEEDRTPPSATTSLHSLLLGSASFEVLPTVEASIANAFPEFTFTAPEQVALPAELGMTPGVTLLDEGYRAQVTVIPDPEYVEREVFGEVFTVLMVSNVAYCYNFSRCDLNGTTEGAAIPEKEEDIIVSDSDIFPADDIVPDDTTTTTETTTTTTTNTTSTSTTTATESTTTTATTTTTTTTTTASNNNGFPRTGVVTTKRLRLNVRSGPGITYAVIAKLDKGDTVSVVDEKDGWYKVELFDGTIGWCTSEYISIKR